MGVKLIVIPAVAARYLSQLFKDGRLVANMAFSLILCSLEDWLLKVIRCKSRRATKAASM